MLEPRRAPKPTTWILLLLLIVAGASVAHAQMGELVQRGMSENQSGRTAAKAFKKRAKMIDRTPEKDWATQDGYLGKVRVERLESGEIRLCPTDSTLTVAAKRAEVGRDAECWRVTSKKKKAQVVFTVGPREIRCKVTEPGTLGLFDVHIVEKEVIHKGHCTFRGPEPG